MKIGFLTIMIVCAVVLLLNHLADLNVSRNDIDDLAVALQDVKKMLQPDSKIAFTSSNTGLDLRYKTQFVMTPIIFKDGAGVGDMVLEVEPKNSEQLPPIDSTGLMYKKESQNFRITLSTRRK